MKRKTVLSIAGSDCSGGAGIQADLKTMLALGVYGMAAVTALTAQNTVGVRDVFPVPPEFLREQLEAVFEDIFPDAVKIGMLCEEELVETTAAALRKWKPKNVVLDPVLVSTSGRRLLEKGAQRRLLEELFPLADLVTPNVPEAEVLTGRRITEKAEMEAAAEAVSCRYGCAVLLKGGHLGEGADDFLWHGGQGTWLTGRRIPSRNSHGTGCTLSSAIAAGLAKGFSMEESTVRAKKYLTGALEGGLDLGAGNGPLDHGFCLE